MKVNRIIVIILLSILSLNILLATNVKATSEGTTEETNIAQEDVDTSNEQQNAEQEVNTSNEQQNAEQETNTSNKQQNTGQDANASNESETNLSEDLQLVDALYGNLGSETISLKAKIVEAGEVYVEEISSYKIKYQDLKVKIKEGEYKDQILPAKYTVSYDLEGKIEGYPLNKGNTVSIEVTVKDGQIDFSSEAIVNDIVRSGYLVWLLILFFAIILVVGRKQGIKAIVALIITILAIFLVMLPGIIKGNNAIWMSVLTCVIVIVLSFIIIAGIKKKSIAAMIGTSGGVICAGIIAMIFGILAKLSGGQEEAMYLSMNIQNITFNFRDLLFAGIVISALGAAMDVGISISSALDELKQKNPNMMAKDLFKSGMNIGGDVIGTMTNTLILAYVGGAINMVLLFMVNNMPLFEILNIEMIATDVVSALAASMGVIFTVPITAAAYALLNNKRLAYNKKSKNLYKGKRSLNI